MRKLAILMTSVLAISVMPANAQCRRGGGGSATGTVSPITTAGFNSPLTSFNTFSTSPNSAFLTAQYSPQQRQNLLAQQRQLQMMAQRQQILERQIQQLQNDGLTTSGDQLASQNADSVKERRRQRNAQKAFEMASRAETSGQVSKAQSHYRRVLRIVGTDSELGALANNALAVLSNDVAGDRRQMTLVANRMR